MSNTTQTTLYEAITVAQGLMVGATGRLFRGEPVLADTPEANDLRRAFDLLCQITREMDNRTLPEIVRDDVWGAVQKSMNSNSPTE